MKAAFRSRYGTPETLRVIEVPRPIPKRNQLLIQVHAATVNRTDCAILSGKPFAMRFFTGLKSPKRKITGTDFAGIVVAIGQEVSRVAVGDRIWGFRGFGLKSHAQYLCLPETSPLSPIPDNISFERAAACAEGGVYALDAIEMLGPRKGQEALVNGATGAIGSAMVQILKYYGLDVTAVCAGKHAGQVQALGADRIVDYTLDDFTRDNHLYDFVFDAVGKSSFRAAIPILKKNGVYTSSEPNFLEVMAGLFRSGKKEKFRPPTKLDERLLFLRNLLEKGHLKPLTDRTYTLDKIADAYSYVAKGEKVGAVLVSIDHGT